MVRVVVVFMFSIRLFVSMVWIWWECSCCFFCIFLWVCIMCLVC